MIDANRRAAKPYLDVAVLTAQVQDYARTGTISDALARSLLLIAGGVWDRYRHTADRDDFIQDCVTHLLQRPLRKADVQKNLFAYFTTCAINYGLNLRAKACCERRRFQTYAEECAEAGRPIPERD